MIIGLHGLILALLIIAIFCSVNWLYLFVMYTMGRLDHATANEQAFQFGLCAILAIGFAGVLLK